ncbi:MAG: hypothetical protein IPJ62_12000 [Betaproteobacteria bacterium]|nr:hypothetical protein [Betaproteobacteria bacterium]
MPEPTTLALLGLGFAPQAAAVDSAPATAPLRRDWSQVNLSCSHGRRAPCVSRSAPSAIIGMSAASGPERVRSNAGRRWRFQPGSEGRRLRCRRRHRDVVALQLEKPFGRRSPSGLRVRSADRRSAQRLLSESPGVHETHPKASRPDLLARSDRPSPAARRVRVRKRPRRRPRRASTVRRSTM